MTGAPAAGARVRRPVSSCTAVAGTNIALVKYWGKRDVLLNLPVTGSLSLTLAELGTRTTVAFDSGEPGKTDANENRTADVVTLDGAPADARTAMRVSAVLDLVRARAGMNRSRARVATVNSVPTAAGLASSASGFAALALAASRAAGLDLEPGELSALARRGSGSAARSIVGGFAEMRKGQRPDGADAVAVPLAAPAGFDVRLVVAITAEGTKAVSSTDGMERTTRTSPFWPAWVDAHDRDMREARAAVEAGDLARLGGAAEQSCLGLHATALTAEPAIIYWNAATVAVLHAVRALRAGGIGAYFTIDAGPHVKVLCAAADAGVVDGALRAVPGVIRTLVASPGPGARVVEETAS